MGDLLDIAPSTSVEIVRIEGTRVTVTGLNANALASIVSRFPTIALLFGGSNTDISRQLIEHFGAAVAPIIAAGCGHLGDEKYEERANTLLLEHQVQLVVAIIGLTFPNGFNSFVAALKKLQPDEGGKKVHMVRLRKSPGQSQFSSDEASRQTIQ